MSHNHNANDVSKLKVKLEITLVLNIIITVAEVIGGIAANSLSLISDALHNLTDAASVVVSYIGIKLGLKDRDYKKTFGYKRAEILAGLINATVLLMVGIYLIKEAYLKFISPEIINGKLMLIVALIGLAANTFSTFLLHSHSHNNMNIKSTYLHLFADALSSLSVVVAGGFIYFFNIYWLDPLITLILSVFIIYECGKIIKNAIHILMQGSPSNINIPELQNELKKINNIENVHHTHIWMLSEDKIFLETHIKVRDMLISKTEELSEKIHNLLHEKFNVTHITIQYEQKDCGE